MLALSDRNFGNFAYFSFQNVLKNSESISSHKVVSCLGNISLLRGNYLYRYKNLEPRNFHSCCNLLAKVICRVNIRAEGDDGI